LSSNERLFGAAAEDVVAAVAAAVFLLRAAAVCLFKAGKMKLLLDVNVASPVGFGFRQAGQQALAPPPLLSPPELAISASMTRLRVQLS
jgi:hypothetical protein